MKPSPATAVMSTVSWFLSVIIVAIAHSCSGSWAQKDVFLMAGQSNMAGRGGVNGGKWDGNVPPECRPSPLIFRLNAQLQWEEAREPLHADIDVGKTCGVGPGMAFANEVVRVGATRGGQGAVGLVPCAVGGTQISQWRRGSPLYNQLVRRASESVRDGGTIRALLWYQGESDTVTQHDADSYKTSMESFIKDLRSDLHIPSLLVIQVSLYFSISLLHTLPLFFS